MIYYRRRSPELWEEVAAAAVGAAAGVAVYYVARAFVGRDALPGPGREARRPDGSTPREGPVPERGSRPGEEPVPEGSAGTDAPR